MKRGVQLSMVRMMICCLFLTDILPVASAYLMSRLNVTSITIMGLELNHLEARDPQWE
jgi:hypothetical protein